jgi:probable rRNA maturation factor
MDNDSSPSIEVTVETASWRSMVTDPEAFCSRVMRHCLKCAAPNLERQTLISVLLTDDETVRELNRTHRHQDKPTNVLSFPQVDDETIDRLITNSVAAIDEEDTPDNPPVMLGDVILALQTVSWEARDQDKALTDHLAHLLVHGCLHLLGHDHEAEDEADRMEAFETAILAEIGVADPYTSRAPA